MKESEKNFDDTEAKVTLFKTRIETIKEKIKGSRHKLSKLKINEIRKNLHYIEKNLTALKIKEIDKNLHELEKNLLKPKNYCDYDHAEYKGIRNVRNLFDLSIDEDYYKPIITNGAFNNNYIQYESMGDKGKSRIIY